MKMLGLDFGSEETGWRVMQVKTVNSADKLSIGHGLVQRGITTVADLQGAEKYGRLTSEAAHRDLAMARTMEQMKAGEAPLVRENMVVVKLENGGVLLYCPVRVQQVRKRPKERRIYLTTKFRALSLATG